MIRSRCRRAWGSPFVAHVRQYEPAFAGLPAYAHDALLRAYLRTAAHATLSKEALRAYMTPWQAAEGQAGFYRQIAQIDRRISPTRLKIAMRR